MNHPTNGAPITAGAPFTSEEIVAATGGKVVSSVSSSHAVQVQGVSTDTRTIQPNSLFVALRGERFDAHNFLAQAHEAGATVAVVEDASRAPDGLVCVRVPDTLVALGNLGRYHRQRFNLPVVGITGSYGKTTTRAFLAAALAPLAPILSSAGNYNNEIGVPQTLFGLDESHQAAVVEMGMRGRGQIEYLAKIALPTIGVITNIGPQHIELLGSVENIARAKAELVQNLPTDGVAVVPADGEFAALLRELSACRVVTFGTSEDADFRIVSTRPHEFGVDVELSLKTQHSDPIAFTLPLPGVHNATNAAAALAVAHELGVDLEAAARALENVDVPGARMRVRRVGALTILDDCYNAGPNSTQAALRTLRDWPGINRRVAVLGSMKELGEWSEAEHRKVGQLANDCCALLIGVGDEMQHALEEAIVEKHWFATADEAAPHVLELLRNDDVVLVKGSRSIGLEAVVETVVNARA